jgi:hypothetical protein
MACHTALQLVCASARDYARGVRRGVCPLRNLHTFPLSFRNPIPRPQRVVYSLQISPERSLGYRPCPCRGRFSVSRNREVFSIVQ